MTPRGPAQALHGICPPPIYSRELESDAKKLAFIRFHPRAGGRLPGPGLTRERERERRERERERERALLGTISITGWSRARPEIGGKAHPPKAKKKARPLTWLCTRQTRTLPFPTSPPLFTAPAPVRTLPPPPNTLHAAPHSARVVCRAIACSVCLYELTRVPGPPIGWPVSVAQPRLA